MRNILRVLAIASGLYFSLTTATFAAAQPLFDLTPLTPTTFQLGRDDVVVIEYRVTNNTSITRELTMQPIPGITQQAYSSGDCSNPFILSAHQTCTLVLLADSNLLPTIVRNGPEICKTEGNGNHTPDPFLCSRPSLNHNLSIVVFPTSPRIIIPLAVDPAILSMETGGPPVTLTVTNHTTTPFSGRNIALQLPTSWLDVTQNAEDCAVLPPNQSCNIVLTPSNIDHATEVLTVKGTNTQPADVTVSSTTMPTVLSESVSLLGLSVSNTALGSALTGNPRKIIISNTGSSTANNVVYSISPSFPTGTSISPANCGNIPAGDTCELTVTPGATASSTPSSLTVSGDNTNAITSQIAVLTYGSVYQTGYVFAVDDTTPDTGSIGGQVAALSDQAPAGAPSSPNGIVWGTRVGIYGVSQSSTPSNPVTSEYQAPGQTACYGSADGLCTTTNIIAYYDDLTSIPTTDYAAGLCAAHIGDYDDWYLPAANQLAGGGQTIGSKLDALGLGNITIGYYWSSTQGSPPSRDAIYVGFNGAGGRFGGGGKNGLLGVRCIRDLGY